MIDLLVPIMRGSTMFLAGPIVILATSVSSIASGQGRPQCSAFMTVRDSRGTTPARSDSVLRMWNELNRETWEWMRAWFQAHPEPARGFPTADADVRDLAEGLGRRIKRDPQSQRIAALALSEMMRGEHGGVELGQDILASTLFRSLRLPPSAVLSLLADPLTSNRARWLAVLALEGHWREPTFYQAAIGALCILAAQVAGIQALTDSSRVEGLLDEDQGDVLLAVVAALVVACENTQRIPLNPASQLPQGHPVTEYVRRELRRADACG